MYGKPEKHVPASLPPHEDGVPFADEKNRALCSLAARYSDGLPALSGSIFRLNELLSNRASDLNAIVRVLSCDPSMAAQVARHAMSRLSEVEAEGQERHHSLDEFVVLIGTGRLRSLVLTTPLAPTDYASTTVLQALGQHCHLTARFAERIAHACGHPEPYAAHLAGLLHDIGEVPVYLERRQHDRTGDDGLDHCIVGGWLAKFWNLPASLIEVIEHHHDPSKARRDPLVGVAAAADEVSRAYGIGLKIQPAAHLAADCRSVLERHLPFLSQQRRATLANVLQVEFLEWVKTPFDIEGVKAATEGKSDSWQSAL